MACGRWPPPELGGRVGRGTGDGGQRNTPALGASASRRPAWPSIARRGAAGRRCRAAGVPGAGEAGRRPAPAGCARGTRAAAPGRSSRRPARPARWSAPRPEAGRRGRSAGRRHGASGRAAGGTAAGAGPHGNHGIPACRRVSLQVRHARAGAGGPARHAHAGAGRGRDGSRRSVDPARGEQDGEAGRPPPPLLLCSTAPGGTERAPRRSTSCCSWRRTPCRSTASWPRRGSGRAARAPVTRRRGGCWASTSRRWRCLRSRRPGPPTLRQVSRRSGGSCATIRALQRRGRVRLTPSCGSPRRRRRTARGSHATSTSAHSRVTGALPACARGLRPRWASHGHWRASGESTKPSRSSGAPSLRCRHSRCRRPSSWSISKPRTGSTWPPTRRSDCSS